MNVTEICTNSAVNILGIIDKKVIEPNTVEEDTIIQTEDIADNFSETDEVTKFRDIVKKYDLSNISRYELNAMYRELYDNKLVGFKDYALATFDPTKIPNYQEGITKVNGQIISSNPNEKTNLLEDLKSQQEWINKYGNELSKKNIQSRIELAEKILYFQS